MDIETILSIHPRELPATPGEVVTYLTMDDIGRDKFNRSNPGFWHKYNQAPEGFFSILRSCLAFNDCWIVIIKEEIRKPENVGRVVALQKKMSDFYRQMYVGPLIGNLLFFREWATPQDQVEPRQDRRDSVGWEE